MGVIMVSGVAFWAFFLLDKTGPNFTGQSCLFVPLGTLK
jgi:hypothetical protein